MVDEVKRLKEENGNLKDSLVDLKLQLETVVLEADEVKQQQEEVIKILQNDDQIMKDRQTGMKSKYCYQKPLKKKISALIPATILLTQMGFDNI